MWQYVIRRLILFTPTLFAISFIAFLISVNAPGDPVERLLNTAEGEQGSQGSRIAEKLRQDMRHRLGLDKPLFYLTLETAGDINASNAVWRDYLPGVRWHGVNNQY